MTEILKGKLFLGDMWDANNVSFIRENNIEIIVCVAKGIIFSKNIEETMKIHRYDIEDTLHHDISIYFDEITELIHEYIIKGQTVLVHCMAGISRSSTITIAYLMRYEYMNLKEALIFVKERRSIICPNRNFLFKLSDYEYKIYYVRKTSFQEAIKILMTSA